MSKISKSFLRESYANTIDQGATAKEYVTLEKNNSSDEAEFAIYGNRLANWLADRLSRHSESPIEYGNILEIGCGMGRILKPLAVRFKWAHGVDISKDILKEAELYLKDSPNVTLYENDGKTLDIFSDDYFDFVISTGVIQHIPVREVIESYLHEAIRALKTNGLFLFTIQAWQKDVVGSGRIGAKITAKWLDEVFSDQPVDIVEITSDPEDPLPHLTILLKKSAQGHKPNFKSQEIIGVPWRTACWSDLVSMNALHEMQRKGQRASTFYDDE